MRILYASERPPYPFFLGGAARCAHQLLYSMANDLGVVCAAVGSADYTLSPWNYPNASEYATLGIRGTSRDGGNGIIDCGYPVRVLPDFANALSDFIDTFKPDVIWSQLEGAKEVLELAARKGIQGLFYIHDAEFDPAELRSIADLGCHIVCSSGFLARKASKVTGWHAHVIYPASGWYFGTDGDPDGYATMINPYRVKGIDTFLDIAKRLPSEKFLLLESWKLNNTVLAELQKLLAEVSNVRFHRRVSDMRLIYGQTKLLLVPSICEEGFGMVAVEAQSCRIPVIASARGGLTESVGDGGILIRDYRNVEEWVKAMGEVLQDRAAYDEWSNRAFCHAGSVDFQPVQVARRFMGICSTEVPHLSAYTRCVRTTVNCLERMPAFGRIFRWASR